MSSFFEKIFDSLAHKPETIFAVLSTSRQQMNCSAVPVTLSTDETWDLLCSENVGNERKLLQLFSTFSDTMQFTEKLRFHRHQDADFIKGILENLINNKRYFSRTIQILQLPSADAFIEACSFRQSSTTTIPILLSNLRSLIIEERFFEGTLQSEQMKPICSHCPFLENLKIPNQWNLPDEGVEFLSNLKYLKTLDLQACYSITDSGLQHIAKLSTLQTLNLESCREITDGGLQHLATLSSLQTLNLESCNKITDEGCRVFSESTKVIR